MGVRLHLCGRLAIEGSIDVVDERQLPGRQGRLALTRLALDRHPISVDRLVDAVWGDDALVDSSGALASLVSKLRACLRQADGCGSEVISAVSGAYQLRLPRGSTIDVVDARTAIDFAEGHRRHGEVNRAWSSATVAVSIARRGLLAGEHLDWVHVVRQELEGIHRRGLECLAWVWTERGDGPLAVNMARQAVALDALHEPSWRALISAHLADGNRAAALQAYERCCATLAEEMGVAPGPELQALGAVSRSSGAR